MRMRELPPLPYKEPKGYAWRGSIAPEVIFGRVHVADHRTGDPDDNGANFVALGGRLEAGVSQHKMGLLEVSARGAFYAAGRIGLLDDSGRTRLLEVTAGEYLYAGDSIRFGVELGFLGLFPTQQKDDIPVRAGSDVHIPAEARHRVENTGREPDAPSAWGDPHPWGR